MKKGSFSTFMLILLLLAGLSLLLYPTFSDYWNSLHQTRAIAQYAQEVERLQEEDYSLLWDRARGYNRRLAGAEDALILSEQMDTVYRQLLTVGQSEVMGYIEIPEISVSLPIFLISTSPP